MIKQIARRLKRAVTGAAGEVPRHLSEKFRGLDPAGSVAIRSALVTKFSSGPEGYLETIEGRNDLESHLCRRLESDRESVIPWLDAARPLLDATILEIGCGTGSSTIALAEQGAKVVAIDVDKESLAVASERCRVYGVDGTFFHANAGEQLRARFVGKRFDFIIFYASLEHMTHEERMTAMRETWNILSPGGLWCVIETPNRLWHYDAHTSLLPFYHWLPDNLAFKYSALSPRASFRGMYTDDTEANRLHFLRRGRGVSFHEFELTMGPADQLDVVSSMQLFHRSQSLSSRLQWKMSADCRYETLLSKVGPPNIHPGFYHQYLYLILRKS